MEKDISLVVLNSQQIKNCPAECCRNPEAHNASDPLNTASEKTNVNNKNDEVKDEDTGIFIR